MIDIFIYLFLGCPASNRGALEELDALPLRQCHNRFLPGPGLPHKGAHTLGLALDVDRVDAQHLHLEDLLDRLADLDLVGVLVDLEGVLVRGNVNASNSCKKYRY